MKNIFLDFQNNKDGFLGDAVAQKDGSCQFNKKLLPLSFKKSFYGLTQFDLDFCNQKLQTQRDYLARSFYHSNFSGEIKSFLDLSMSANFSKKYYAELVNRSNLLNSYAFDYDLIPIFLTITLNGCFRKALNGDFASFKTTDKKFFDYTLKYKFSHNQAFNIRDLINLLNRQWNLFVMRIHRKYKNLTKFYIRCFEPHKKDGVPHIHALLYIPKYAFDYVFKIYKELFNAPQNLKQGNKLSKEQVKNGEINGFQWSLNNPTGYLMKYIYKTFINFNERQDLDYLSAWYVKYKVRRFLTSKTSVPLWIYRKINFFKKDFYHLCNLVNNSDFLCEWSFDKKYFCFVSDKESIEYNNGILIYKFMDRVLYRYEKEQLPKEIKHYKEYKFKPKDRDKFPFYLYKNAKHPLNDYALMSLISSDDFKYFNSQKIVYHRNLAIERGLIDDKKIDINSIDDFDLIEKGFKYVF